MAQQTIKSLQHRSSVQFGPLSHGLEGDFLGASKNTYVTYESEDSFSDICPSEDHCEHKSQQPITTSSDHESTVIWEPTYILVNGVPMDDQRDIYMG